MTNRTHDMSDPGTGSDCGPFPPMTCGAKDEIAHYRDHVAPVDIVAAVRGMIDASALRLDVNARIESQGPGVDAIVIWSDPTLRSVDVNTTVYVLENYSGDGWSVGIYRDMAAWHGGASDREEGFMGIVENVAPEDARAEDVAIHALACVAPWRL